MWGNEHDINRTGRLDGIINNVDALTLKELMSDLKLRPSRAVEQKLSDILMCCNWTMVQYPCVQVWLSPRVFKEEKREFPTWASRK